MKLEQQVAKTIAEYQMLLPAQPVLVALSGGADSVALLYVLRALGYSAFAFHLNHCLRGQESVRDEMFVRALCAQLQVPLTVACIRVSDYAQQKSIETAAREIRYDQLFACAQQQKITRIATAHTADDNLETMLFHLTRGTGTKGMAGIPPVRGQVIRPFWAITRAQVEQYLSEKQQVFVTDSSNLTLDYTRNQIRQLIVPQLRQINGQCVQAAHRLSVQLRQDEDALQALAEQALAQGKTTKGILADVWDTFPAVQSRMWFQLLRKAGVPMQKVSARHIAQLQALTKHAGACNLPAGFCAYREGNYIQLVRQPERPPLALFDGFCQVLWDTKTRLTVTRKKTSQIFRKTHDTFLADCGTIHFSTLTVRTFAPNDRIHLAGTKGARQLKRIFTDLRIGQMQRSQLAVIADKNGIVAVQNVGVNQNRIPCGQDIIEFRFEGL